MHVRSRILSVADPCLAEIGTDLNSSRARKHLLVWSRCGRFCLGARQHTSAVQSLRLCLLCEAAIFKAFEGPVSLGGGIVAFATEPGSMQRAHSSVGCYVKRPFSFPRALFAFLSTVFISASSFAADEEKK